MKFLFGEPTFVTSDNIDVRNCKIEDDSIVISPAEKKSFLDSIKEITDSSKRKK